MDLRPTLDVDNLRAPASLTTQRRLTMEQRLKSTFTDADLKRIASILRTYRARQTRLLKERDEDPSPYNPKYIFYCLTGKREVDT